MQNTYDALQAYVSSSVASEHDATSTPLAAATENHYAQLRVRLQEAERKAMADIEKQQRAEEKELREMNNKLQHMMEA